MAKLASSHFKGNRVVGGMVYNNQAEVFSDMQVHEDGFGRVLLRGEFLSIRLYSPVQLLRKRFRRRWPSDG